MPLKTSYLGNTLTDTVFVDPRWLISFAAGIGDHNPCYVDTTNQAIPTPTNDFHTSGLQGSNIIAHPLFVWAVEWPSLWLRASAQLFPNIHFLDHEKGKGTVHYAQDVLIHRPIQACDTLVLTCTLVALKKRRQGVVTVYKFDHHDKDGCLVAETFNTAYWRGLSLDGDSCQMAPRMLPPPLPTYYSAASSTVPLLKVEMPIAPYAGVIYAECARIWNPIHTDKAAAVASGLPDTILHGTCTMAKAISCIVQHYAGDDPRRVQRVAVGSFSAIVVMPSVVVLRVWHVHVYEHTSTAVHYDVLNGAGDPAIKGGLVVFSGNLARL